jgi:hypothetical protein
MMHQGTVKDNSGKALPGVSIKMKESTNVAITDAAGKFSIQMPGKWFSFQWDNR